MINYNNVKFEKSYGFANQLPVSEAPEIAFSGRSNVGKSSLLNKLFGRKNIARVSSVPGKTITVNFFDASGIKFVDLPGYGYAKAPVKEIDRWGEMIEHYFNSGRNISLVVQLIDMRRKATDKDFQMIDFLEQTGLPYVIVLTKSDKLKPTERKRREQEIEEEFSGCSNVAVIPFSSLNGEGVVELKAEIEYYLS